MRIDIKSYSSKSSLVSSIIFFIIGAILTAYSERIMTAAYKVIGVVFLAITIGIILSIVVRKKKEQPIYANRVAIGIITLVLAILFFFFHGIIDEAIRFIVGAWILFSGVTRLINALRTDHKASRFIALLIVSILLIILGFVTIIKNGILLWVVGIIIMIYSAIEIVGYIFYSKDNKNFDSEEDSEDKLLIPEKKDEEKSKKKNKKIKDVEDEDIEEK
jgi:uncharacterized membrane protein HdeD (DUF308 family)